MNLTEYELDTNIKKKENKCWRINPLPLIT